MGECKVGDRKMKIYLPSHNEVNTSEAEMAQIEMKLTQSESFDIDFNKFGHNSWIRINPRVHESDIAHFVEVINFKEAMDEVPGNAFYLKLKYSTITKNVDNPLLVKTNMKHIIYIRTEGDYFAKIVECLNELLKNHFYCIRELLIILNRYHCGF